MRGRTNIPPRKQPAINGDVENFIVASGNTIAKGDFVSYVLNQEYISFDSRTMELKYKWEYDEVNHKYVLVFLNNGTPIVMLVQVVDGDVVVLDDESISIVDGTFGGVCLDGEYIYVSNVTNTVVSSKRTIVVKKYQIVLDEIVYIEDKTNTIDAYLGNPIGIAVRDSKVYYAYAYSNTGSNISYIYAYYGEFGDTITSSQQIVLSSVSYRSYTEAFFIPYVFDSNHIVFVSSIYYDSLSSKSTNIKVINVSDNTSQNYSINDSDYGKHFWDCDKFGSKLCVVSRYVYIYEYSNGELTVLYASTDQMTKKPIMGRIGQNKFVVLGATNSNTKLFEVDGTVVLTENLLNTVVNYSSGCILSDYVKGIVIDCSTQYGVVKYYGEETTQGFVIGQPTNYVQSYNGGYTVGFAKTGGTAGSTIQVYVPHNNS